MANEGVIKVVYPIPGLATITAKILKPDDTVRDGQTAVALDDTGHANVYTNAGAITIEAGDNVIPYVDGVNYGSGETYQPDATVVNVDDCKADISDIESTITKLDDTLEDDGGIYRFTENALEQAPTAEMDAAELEAAMKAITGITVGGDWTWEKIMKIVSAWIAGNWRVKPTDSTKQELMDAEDGTTVILEQSLTRSPAVGADYRTIEVKI